MGEFGGRADGNGQPTGGARSGGEGAGDRPGGSGGEAGNRAMWGRLVIESVRDSSRTSNCTKARARLFHLKATKCAMA